MVYGGNGWPVDCRVKYTMVKYGGKVNDGLHGRVYNGYTEVMVVDRVSSRPAGPGRRTPRARNQEG